MNHVNFWYISYNQYIQNKIKNISNNYILYVTKLIIIHGSSIMLEMLEVLKSIKTIITTL